MEIPSQEDLPSFPVDVSPANEKSKSIAPTITLGCASGTLKRDTKNPKDKNMKGMRYEVQPKLPTIKLLIDVKIIPFLMKEIIIRIDREKKINWTIE